MDRRRLDQIMHILLMPYKEEALIDEDNDYLNNIRRSYFQARKEVSQKGYIKDKSETQYRKCVRELETFVKYHNRLRISSMDDMVLCQDLVQVKMRFSPS